MPTPPWASRLPALAAVAAGGAVGATARQAVSALANPAIAGAGFPWGTLAANLVGALVMGLLARRALSLNAASFWRTGVLGGFTTFSAFSLEAVHLAERHPLVAAAYVGVSLLGGVAAAAIGTRGEARSG